MLELTATSITIQAVQFDVDQHANTTTPQLARTSESILSSFEWNVDSDDEQDTSAVQGEFVDKLSQEWAILAQA